MRTSWEQVLEGISQCEKCGLCKTRHSTVPGEGNVHARVLFVGEGPGADEDAQGRPFVGRAGQLLTQMILAIGLKREEVYIANIVKCRPPQNRTPLPEEAQACLPWLRMQTGLIKPDIIVCLGATAGKWIIDPELRITRDRGKWVHRKGVWILPTFHPSALLRDESLKRPAWEDMKKLRDKLRELEAADVAESKTETTETGTGGTGMPGVR